MFTDTAGVRAFVIVYKTVAHIIKPVCFTRMFYLKIVNRWWCVLFNFSHYVKIFFISWDVDFFVVSLFTEQGISPFRISGSCSVNDYMIVCSKHFAVRIFNSIYVVSLHEIIVGELVNIVCICNAESSKTVCSWCRIPYIIVCKFNGTHIAVFYRRITNA